MLFKFKSKACADLIMLEADARRILRAMIGHDPDKGIIAAADLPQAIRQLEAAVAHDEALRRARDEQAAQARAEEISSADDPQEALPAIRLAQRAVPMQQMLRRCLSEEADLVWGV